MGWVKPGCLKGIALADDCSWHSTITASCCGNHISHKQGQRLLVTERRHKLLLSRCLIYQNVIQGLIAGGTYTGDVYVWDLSQEGDFQVFKSTLSASSHQ